MTSLSHLTSYTPIKSNSYLANSLAAPVSEPALYRLLTFHVPNLTSLSRCLRRTPISFQVLGTCLWLLSIPVIMVRGWQHLAQTSDWRTTLCRLSATAYLIYWQLPFILEAVTPSATWARTMPWWQGTTYHGPRNLYFSFLCLWKIKQKRKMFKLWTLIIADVTVWVALLQVAGA